jgi:hypothetical protein
VGINDSVYFLSIQEESPNFAIINFYENMETKFTGSMWDFISCIGYCENAIPHFTNHSILLLAAFFMDVVPNVL